MKKIDFIIVGDGYAAMFFAHQLIKNNHSFVLFSENKKSASQISAGIINPVVLKRFSSFWKAKEQIDFLKHTLSEIQDYTGVNYLINEPIHRVFHDESEKNLWLKKSNNENLKDFLDPTFIHLDGIENPYQTGRVIQSARLNVDHFFGDMMDVLESRGHLIHERFNFDDLNTNDKHYQSLYYQYIIFCEGIHVKHNPYFSDIPVNSNKGHHLKIKFSTPYNRTETIKKKHFLFPLNEELFYYGGTYDREQLHHEMDESAKNELIKGIGEFYKNSIEVEEVNFGFRPVVADRRPILGNHNEFRNLFVFNGLGARGILNGSYFAHELYQHILYQKPLSPEVDIKRFAK